MFSAGDPYLARARTLAQHSLLFESFLVREREAGRLPDIFAMPAPAKAYVHGHCHQKAMGQMPAVQGALRLIRNLDAELIDSACCGMAGSFGYEKDHLQVSLAMAELKLLPAVRKAPAGALIVADGTSCRSQIAHGASREALHVARVSSRLCRSGAAKEPG